VLEGKQAIDSKTNKPTLTCVPIKISKSMKISKATGNCNGFWIQKGSITVKRFENLSDADGTVLKSGTYYIYSKIMRNYARQYLY